MYDEFYMYSGEFRVIFNNNTVYKDSFDKIMLSFHEYLSLWPFSRCLWDFKLRLSLSASFLDYWTHSQFWLNTLNQNTHQKRLMNNPKTTHFWFQWVNKPTSSECIELVVICRHNSYSQNVNKTGNAEHVFLTNTTRGSTQGANIAECYFRINSAISALKYFS